MQRPTPTGKEIRLDPKKHIVSKTDIKGNILYANDYFTEIAGYDKSELIGTPHNILRHPDMPKAVFKLMWDSIKANQNITAVVKNLAKNGDHYWIVTDFDIQKDANGGIKNYIAYRQVAPRHVIEEIEPLYKTLKGIEDEHGMEASIEYLTGFLQEKNMGYHQYIEELAKPSGLTAMFFAAMKKLF
ncbi:MAG: PAS domain-containing protein [Campylobacterota bacterium]|nr:PAS domain-containing protein [Campylobacterota bacterium]